MAIAHQPAMARAAGGPRAATRRVLVPRRRRARAGSVVQLVTLVGVTAAGLALVAATAIAGMILVAAVVAG